MSDLGVIGTGLVPRENNGSVPVGLQDQTSRMLDLRFIQAAGSPTTLTVDASIDDMTITVASAIGFLADQVVGLFTPAGEFYFGRQVGAPSGNIISLDTPLDSDFLTTNTTVFPFVYNLNVDGSSITQAFQIGPIGAPVGQAIDITRITGYIQDDGAMDDALFGGIAELTKGVVLRHYNGFTRNIWNVKTNGELAEICASDFYYTDKAPAGSNGARFRNTFNGQDKHGVVARLEAGDTLQILIQDDLTGLEKFTVMAQGHFVTM